MSCDIGKYVMLWERWISPYVYSSGEENIKMLMQQNT
jgi:hypothetical protein